MQSQKLYEILSERNIPIIELMTEAAAILDK